MRTRSGKEGTNARARFRLYDRVRARQAGKQAGGQPTNSQLSSRIYSRVISLPSRAVVTSRPRSPAARIRVMTFSTAALKIAPRPYPPLYPARPLAPLQSPYRSAKSGDYPRTIVPLFTSRRSPPRTYPPIARVDTCW